MYKNYILTPVGDGGIIINIVIHSCNLTTPIFFAYTDTNANVHH